MDLNRNQFFAIAVFLVLLGVQFRMVSSYVLTPETTRFLAERAQQGADPVGSLAGATPELPANLPPKSVSPPDWLGWCLISVGAVLFFHSLTMSKPG
ncbi:hypothetical protein [Botrimarina sp.]|uniref:hypothetical protein n=1 Tax=Botrimarina sp. TaxID=2795802 RepID=UPI0032EB9DC3